LIEFREADYEMMERVLEKLTVWVGKMEEKIKQKYNGEAERWKLLREEEESERIYKKYLLDCETSDFQDEY
jgi:hypothetical protein